MADGAMKFSCNACGKSYGWKPELAGRQAKCKCGQVMTVPAEPPAPPEEDALYDLAPSEAVTRRAFIASSTTSSKKSETEAVATIDMPRSEYTGRMP